MANTKNYTEHGGSVTHIGGELVLDPGSKIIKDGQEIDIGGSLPPVEGSGKVLVSVNGEWVEQDGYGYTEKGDQTVITWDGDTSGHVSAYDTYYKVANYTAVTKSDLIGCIVSVENDEDHPTPIEIVESEINDSTIQHAIMVSDYAIFVSEPTTYGPVSFTESGIYFPKFGEQYVSSLTYGTPDTIHKIDEKYLPMSGGVMVVNFIKDGDAISSDKTIEEVKEAMKTNAVIGTLKWVDSGTVLFDGGLGCATMDDEGNPAFGCYCSDSKWIKQVGVDNDAWAFGIES